MTKLVLDEAALPVLFENLNFNSVSTCISSECDFYSDFKGRFFYPSVSNMRILPLIYDTASLTFI